MSSIIHALLRHHKDKDDKKQQNEKTERHNVTSITDSTSDSSIVHTNVSDDVQVQSTVSSETNVNAVVKNSKKINDLMSKLGSTHDEIDECSKKRTAEINEAATRAIDKVVSETTAQQQKLVSDAQDHARNIEAEYKKQLEDFLAKLDAEKAVLLAELERSLNERQETILTTARQEIDQIQNLANERKLAIFKQAQAKVNQQIDQITEKVAEIVAEDAQRRLQSTTQTIIKTTAVASGDNHSSAANVASGTATNTRKTSESH